MRAKLARLKKTFIILIAAVLIVPLGIMLGLALPGKYLTLSLIGDSYSAGNGAGQYYADGYKSARNWGHTYQKWLNDRGIHTIMHDFAISGAVTLSDPPKTDKDILYQVDLVPADTDVVMMTAGGNDVKFSSIIAHCYTVWPLTTSNQCRDQVNLAYQLLPKAMNGVEDVFEKLQAKLKRKDARIIYVGYPLLAQNDSYKLNTWTQTPYDASREIRNFGHYAQAQQQNFVNNWNADPNHTLKVTYVPLISKFTGHEPNPGKSNPYRWINEFWEDNAYQPADGQPVVWSSSGDLMVAYHPNVTGHAKIAEQLSTVVSTDLPYRMDNATNGRDVDVTFLVDISKDAADTLATAKRQVPLLAGEIEKETAAAGTRARYELYRFTQPYWYKELQNITTNKQSVLTALNNLSLDSGGDTEGYAAPRAIEDAIYWAGYDGNGDRTNAETYKDRKVMYVFTDGKIKNYRESDWLDRLMQDYKRDAVEIWLVVPDKSQVDANFEKFSRNTGGDILSFDQVDKIFAPKPVAGIKLTNQRQDGLPYAQNEAVQFSAADSHAEAPGATITKYEWDFNNDGVVDTTSEGATNSTASYTYNTPYTGPARVTVTDSNGNTATATVDVTVSRDGDTKGDTVDNCVDVRNEDQNDTDKDGKGDACDPLDAKVTVDPQGAYPGQSLTLTASGYGPQEPVTFTVKDAAGNMVYTSAAIAADQQGTATTTWAIGGSQASGEYTVEAASSRGAAPATTATVYDRTAKSLALSQPDALPGEKVTISAGGFVSGDRVTITAGTATVCTKNADGNVSVNCDWTVPADTPVSTIEIKAAAFSGSATKPLQILSPATNLKVTADPSVIASGKTSTITVQGFNPGETVTFAADGEAFESPVTTDEFGTASIQFTGPASGEDKAYTISATSRRGSGTTTVKVLTPLSNLSASVDPNPVLPGESVTLKAFGFKNDDGVDFTFWKGDTQVGGVSAGATVEPSSLPYATDTDGIAQKTITLPSQIGPGTYTVRASNARGTATTTLEVLTKTTPTVTLDQSTLVQGESTLIRAYGYVPGETVNFYSSTGTPLGSAPAIEQASPEDPNGSTITVATLGYTVPQDRKPGTYTVTTQGRAGSATADVTVLQKLNLTVTVTPQTVVRGGTVTATASAEGLADTDGPVVFSLAPVSEELSDGSTDPTLFELGSAPVVNGVATLTNATVNAGVPAGDYRVVATIRRGSGSAELTVTQELNSELTVDKQKAVAGQTVNYSANGFNPGESVIFTIDGEAKLAVTADQYGVATYVWAIPADFPTKDVAATASSTRGTSNTFTVSVLSMLNPTLTVGDQSYIAGEKATVEARAFGPNEEVTFTFPDGSTTKATTDDQGVVRVEWQVPSTQETKKLAKFKVANARGSATATADLLSLLTPTVTVTPNPVIAGNQVTVTAQAAFEEGEQVTFTLPNNSTATATASNGEAKTTWTVPSNQAAGDLSVTASTARGEGTGTFTVRPVLASTLTATPATIVAGGVVRFEANGFENGEQVTFTIDGEEYTAKANATGIASYEWTVPADHAQGSVQAQAKTDRGTSNTATVSVLPLSADVTVTVDKAVSNLGDTITVKATGFGSSQTVTFTFPDGTTTEETSSPTGEATATWKVPATQPASDKATFQAYTKTRAGQTTAKILGVITPTVTVEPSTVIAGNTVDVTASGFEPGETVTFTYPSQPDQTTTANAQGTATATWTVPATASAGAVTVGARSSRGTGTAELTVRAQLASTLTATPNPVIAGNSVTFSADGFEPGEEVTFTLPDGTTVTTSADDNGTATTTWVIPSTYTQDTATVTASSPHGTGSTEIAITPALAGTVSADRPLYLAGMDVTFTITGLQPGETGTLTIGEGDTAKNLPFTASGTTSTATITLTTDDTLLGSLPVVASTSRGATEPVSVLILKPSVLPNLNPVTPGSEVILSVDGLQPGMKYTLSTCTSSTLTTCTPIASGLTADDFGGGKTKWTVPEAYVLGVNIFIRLSLDDYPDTPQSIYLGYVLSVDDVAVTVTPTPTPTTTPVSAAPKPTTAPTTTVKATTPVTTTTTTRTPVAPIAVTTTASPSDAAQPTIAWVIPEPGQGPGGEFNLQLGALPSEVPTVAQDPANDPLATTGAQLRDKLIYASVLVMAGLVLVFAMRRRSREDAGEREA